MKANRRTDTKPELALRHALHRLGYRYRKDYRLDLASGRRVRPDVAFTARKVAVFVDGCFWHACPEHGSKPRANEWYWGPKLIKNVERDRINDAALILAGWTVVRLWEHVPLEEAVAAVVAALAANGAPTANSATSESSAGETSNAVAESSTIGQDRPGQDQPGQDQADQDQAGHDQAGPRESPAAGDDSLS
jgi:DNA mismatch endonuclease, patch repair protein